MFCKLNLVLGAFLHASTAGAVNLRGSQSTRRLFALPLDVKYIDRMNSSRDFRNDNCI